MTTDYECGTCGSQELQIKSLIAGTWTVTCSNGHIYVPTGSEVIILSPTIKQLSK